jgi:hypothetical protein
MLTWDRGETTNQRPTGATPSPNDPSPAFVNKGKKKRKDRGLNAPVRRGKSSGGRTEALVEEDVRQLSF